MLFRAMIHLLGNVTSIAFVVTQILKLSTITSRGYVLLSFIRTCHKNRVNSKKEDIGESRP